MNDHDENPLRKEVPTHLFRFEPRLFGMTLSQFLSDLGAGILIFSLTAALPLAARIIVSVGLAMLVLILVHGKVQDQSFLRWFSLACRFRFVPKRTTWQSPLERQARKRGRVPSVQHTWIPLDRLSRGIAGYQEGKGGPGRYWVVFAVEGRPVRYLPEEEQRRLFGRFETFLAGLSFRLQFISQTQTVHSQTYAPLLAQQQALTQLASFPRLARLLQATIAFQQQELPSCTTTRHYVVVSVSAREEAAQTADRASQGNLRVLSRLFQFKRPPPITQDDLLDQLRVRISVLSKLFQQLDVRARLLDDPALLHVFASCLAPGADVPSFVPQRAENPARTAQVADLARLVSQAREQHDETRSCVPASHGLSPAHLPRSTGQAASRSTQRLQGLHGAWTYTSTSEQARFEAAVLHLADLLAPSAVEVRPDTVLVDVGGRTCYQRSFMITGYGHHLLCGWTSDFTELGLPLTISSTFDPIDTPFMIRQLEVSQLKLKSQQVADRKTERLTTADQSIEAEQVRRVVHALSAGQLQIFAVQLTIGIHASSEAGLEQRSRLLLSHLRLRQFTARSATRQHDVLWQASLPTCSPVALDRSVTLPSDALSTFLHASSGTIGTPRGVFLGFMGPASARRPVYFDPWSQDRKLPNPHLIILGDSGQGKSVTGKSLSTGLMALGIADVVVLDRDDDYLPLHQELGGESQRIVLARGCPINFFDLPYAPADVDPDEQADLLSEYIDNQLLTGLALLLCDVGTPLTRIEEAYLMHVARAAYAAQGITSEAIRHDPQTLLRPMPTLADFIETMRTTPASHVAMQASLIERLEKASYLFRGQTSVRLDTPLTVFSIHDLDEKWYPLMTFTVQNFLLRHRALRQDERFLAYVVEEASYMLKHPAGRKYLESGSRGFRKLGIALITISQHPREMLEEGQVILSNAGTAIFLGMQRTAAQKLNLSPELERVLVEAIPGQAVIRYGNVYAPMTIAISPTLHTVFTTDPRERRDLRRRARPSVEARAS